MPRSRVQIRLAEQDAARAAAAKAAAEREVADAAALQPTKPFLGTAIPFTPEAAASLHQEIYPELKRDHGYRINASKLFGRLTTNARKIAGILAVIAGEPAVSASWGACQRQQGGLTARLARLTQHPLWKLAQRNAPAFLRREPDPCRA